jgi:hypothetical protein
LGQSKESRKEGCKGRIRSIGSANREQFACGTWRRTFYARL